MSQISRVIDVESEYASTMEKHVLMTESRLCWTASMGRNGAIKGRRQRDSGRNRRAPLSQRDLWQRGLTKVGTECSMWAGQRIDRDKNASWETKSSALTTFHRCILTRHHIGGNQKGDSEEKGLLILNFNSILQLLYWGMIQTRICAGNIVFILFCRAQFEPCHLFILENQIELIYRHQRNI